MERDRKLDFLFDKCPNIRPVNIINIEFTPSFCDAIKEYPGSLDENTVYEICCRVYDGILESGGRRYKESQCLKKIARDIGKLSDFQSKYR